MKKVLIKNVSAALLLMTIVSSSSSAQTTSIYNSATAKISSNKTVHANYDGPNIYKLNITTGGVGEVKISPAGGEYAKGTVVTLSGSAVLGSHFLGWTGDVNGQDSVIKITMNSVKNVTASFSSSIAMDFNKAPGFASVTAKDFTGSTTGGSKGTDTVFINGPAEFGKFCQLLQDRIKYTNYSNHPLTIVLEEGVYTGAGAQLGVWQNEMLTVQEQENLTIIGRKNVTLKFGLNIRQSSNLIIRNITFQDYYTAAINVGEIAAHHIWIDHCTVGGPAFSNPPNKGIDIREGASYVTVSWSQYYISSKANLASYPDSNIANEIGGSKLTYFCNHFFHKDPESSMDRFREVQFLNNLEDEDMLYKAVGATGPQVYKENNFFQHTSNDFSKPALFDPGEYYSSSAYSRSTVRVIVPLFAGADKVDFWSKNEVVTPADLVSFRSTILNNNVVLNWKTENEKNIDYYIIERSNNGSVFSETGKVVSFKRSSVNTYRFKDDGPLSQKSYYRLKIIDKDGGYKTSNVIVVNKAMKENITAYPNPSASNLVISHDKAIAGARFKVATLKGNIISSMNATIDAVVTTIDVTQLPASVYLVTFENGQDRSTLKFIKE